MGSTLGEKIKYWMQLLLLPVYGLSFLIPRKKRLWLFGSTFGRRYADNPRYLYQYVHNNKEKLKIRPIWISRNRIIIERLQREGYEAYYYHSLKGIWCALRAKTYIFDNYSKDINFWQSGGALKINLWHGIGNKRINYDNEHDNVRHPKSILEKIKYFPRRLSDEKPSHYILATSEMMKKIFARAFNVSDSHVILCGYPRNDILLNKKRDNILLMDKERDLLERMDRQHNDGMKILGYIPTFRPSEHKFMEIMNLEEFNTFLKNENLILITKLHPKSAFKKDFEKLSYSNIYNVDADVDVNIFLGEIDVLIADYSSVYSDFILTGKPAVAFHYDFNEYVHDTRDGYFDFKDYMPEVKAENMDELIAGIKQVLKNDTCKDARVKSRKIMFKDIDGNACEKLTNIIKQLEEI